MFPSAYYHFPPPPKGKFHNDGLLDIQLATSRDGIRWTRVERGPFIRLGEAGSLEGGCLYMGVGMIRKGDEIWMYYTGFRFTHGNYDFKRDRNAAVIRKAIVRLDGFTSADTDYSGGELVTKLLKFKGKRLQLNVDTSALGEVRVEIADRTGKSFKGFAAAECDPIHGNYIAKVVTWEGRSDVSALAGRAVRLRFVMRSAKLYAFQFVEAAAF